MNVPLKVLTVFRNNSMAFCFHLSLQNLIPKKSVLNRNTMERAQHTANRKNTCKLRK